MKSDIFKKGMSLIEVMIALTIFTISIGGISLLFIKTWENNRYVLEMGQSSMAVSEGARKMASYIRMSKQGDDGAYPIKLATNNELVLYSDYDKNNTTERLHFYKSGQSIIMGITSPTGTNPKTYPAGDQQTITIVNNIVNGINEPIFYYYNKNYPSDMSNNPLISPINVADIRLIKIDLRINIDPNKAPENIQTQLFVELRNLK